MENSPFSFVDLRRVMPVSDDVSSTRAPDTLDVSGPVTLPITISVVDPTCADADRVKPAINAMTNSEYRSRAEARMSRE